MRRAPRAGSAGRLHAAPAGARRVIAAALCAAAIVCAGCGAAATPQSVVGASAGVTARLSLSPEPAPVMRPLQLSVTLAGAGGQPIVDRTVSFDLSMPAMAMPPNRPKVTAAGDGVYEATTLLSMAGDWQLTVEIGGSGPPQTIPLSFSAQ